MVRVLGVHVWPTRPGVFHSYTAAEDAGLGGARVDFRDVCYLAMTLALLEY